MELIILIYFVHKLLLILKYTLIIVKEIKNNTKVEMKKNKKVKLFPIYHRIRQKINYIYFFKIN